MLRSLRPRRPRLRLRVSRSPLLLTLLLALRVALHRMADQEVALMLFSWGCFALFTGAQISFVILQRRHVPRPKQRVAPGGGGGGAGVIAGRVAVVVVPGL